MSTEAQIIELSNTWLKVNITLAVLELAQSGFITAWVYLGHWWLVALSASTFLGMLVMHLLSGINIIATRIIIETRARDGAARN